MMRRSTRSGIWFSREPSDSLRFGDSEITSGSRAFETEFECLLTNFAKCDPEVIYRSRQAESAFQGSREWKCDENGRNRVRARNCLKRNQQKLCVNLWIAAATKCNSSEPPRF